MSGPRSNPPARYEHLDGLRGIAAMSVAIGHIRWPSAVSSFPLFTTTSLWVDFFFVLSGFVIAHTYLQRLQDGLTVRSFMWRRFARLYPLHLVMLLAAVGFEVGKWALFARFGGGAQHAPFERNNIQSFVANLALVQALVFPYVTWNAPSWSISVEFYTYLLFGLLVVGLRKRLGALVPVLSAAVVICYIVLMLAPGERFLSVEAGFGIFRCVAGFAIGVIVQRFAPVSVVSTGRNYLAPIVLLMALALISLPTYETAWTLLAPPIFGVFVWLMLRDQHGVIFNVLASRPCQILGAWSYAIYMTHRILGLTVQNVYEIVGAKHHIPGDVFTVAYLVAVLLASWISYNLIEKPAQSWLNGLANRKNSIA